MRQGPSQEVGEKGSSGKRGAKPLDCMDVTKERTIVPGAKEQGTLAQLSDERRDFPSISDGNMHKPAENPGRKE